MEFERLLAATNGPSELAERVRAQEAERLLVQNRPEYVDRRDVETLVKKLILHRESSFDPIWDCRLSMS